MNTRTVLFPVCVAFFGMVPPMTADPILRGNILKADQSFARGEKVTVLVHVFNPDENQLRATETETWAEFLDRDQNVLKRTNRIAIETTIAPHSLHTFRIQAELPEQAPSDLSYRVFLKNRRTFQSPAKPLTPPGEPTARGLVLKSARPHLFTGEAERRGRFDLTFEPGPGETLGAGELTAWIEFSREEKKLFESIRVQNPSATKNGRPLTLKIPFLLGSEENRGIRFRVHTRQGELARSFPPGHSFSLEEAFKALPAGEPGARVDLANLREYELQLSGGREKAGYLKNLYSDGLEVVDQETPLGASSSTRGEGETSLPSTTEWPDSGSAAESSTDTKVRRPLPEGFFTIETPDESIVVYQVREGDNLRTISKKFFGDESRFSYIAELNFISDKKSIKRGEELIVEVYSKKGSKSKVALADPVPVATSTKKKTPVRGAGRTHTIKQGESLALVARKFYGNDMAFKKIMQANGIKDVKKVRPGTVLVIPD